MPGQTLTPFTDGDILFLMEAARLREIGRKENLRRDESWIERTIREKTDDLIERLFSLREEQLLIRISPRLLFQILLANAARILGREQYLLERIGRQVIPVFDTKNVADFLTREGIIPYLAEMLASFGRIETFTMAFREKRGIWRKMRFNTMDIDGLIGFSSIIEEEARFPFYKRIADICLFTVGMFPEYVATRYRYPSSGELRPSSGGQRPRAPEEYDADRARYFGLAAGHDVARRLGLDTVLNDLAGNFRLAKKPLNFIAGNYLRFKKQLFPYLDG
jgi:hypothetical protein